ncbi:unnamed protein product [Calicophoron daubneyi]|uniref:Secretory carrier-associated membrane protein n=1 Tax=Calicophoron daubneyi TaxID=300641 RepID=A0AAV2TD41_CALDB
MVGLFLIDRKSSGNVTASHAPQQSYQAVSLSLDEFSRANVKQDPLDDYNPFSEPEPPKHYGSNAAVLSGESSETMDEKKPTVGFVSGGDLSKGGVTMEPMMNTDAILALERRQAELEARAAELDRREKEQEARMSAYQASAPPHNWPPLPVWCPCKPCVRQDFEADIPLDCRWMAKMGYALWLAYSVILMFNLAGTLSYFVVDNSSVAGPLFGASILLLLIMPPLSFFSWHRPLYKALRSDSSVNYILFFVLFTVQCIIILIQCLGIDYLGSCGWINGLKICRTSATVCSYMLFVAALFTAAGAACGFLLLKVHRHYRTSGASLRKAKLEMTSAAAYEASTGFGAMP